MNLAEQVREKLLDLQAALLEAHPRMPGLLREIHTQLKNDPECVTLLSEEEIHIVVQGLERQTATELMQETIKKSKSTKGLKNLTVNDL